MGKVVKSGAGPYVYTCTPLMPAAGDAAELPYLSYVEQIRPGGGVVLDRQAVGLAVEGFQITVGSGPGRANSKISVELVGSGKVIDSATGITMPAATTEKLLPSASLTLSINGVDYVTNKNIVSLETGWKNNIRMDAGFFPGSGFQTAGDGSTGAIRGRLEFGNRVGNLKFVARFMNGSDEYTKLKAQTTGTAVVTLAYDANNSLQLTWQQVTYSVVEIAETDQILTVAVECLPMYHVTNGILTAVGKMRRGRNLLVRTLSMDTNAPVFDATRPVAIQLRGPDGTKTVRVRFPSDDEWAERQRRRKVIVKQLGRGISETTIPNGEDIDAALLAKIRTEEEPEVDAFEAQKVIEQLATCDVDDVVLAGDSFRVVLRVLGRYRHAPPEDAVREGREPVPARLRPRAGPAVQPAGVDHQRARGRRPVQEAHRRDRGVRRRRSGHPPGRRGQSRHRRSRRLLPGGSGRKFLAGEWPENPSLRYLVHWALRRDELCDPGLCPDAPDGGRCDHCPQDQLDAAQTSEAGLLIRRALDLRAALNLGIHVGLDDIPADEFYTMLILDDERDQLDRERTNTHGK